MTKIIIMIKVGSTIILTFRYCLIYGVYLRKSIIGRLNSLQTFFQHLLSARINNLEDKHDVVNTPIIS